MRAEDMPNVTESRVPLSKNTRFELKQAKRGGETYDALFQKMLKQYDPDAALARQTRDNA